MTRDESWRSMLEPLPPVHPWHRLDARRIQCSACGLRAHSEWDDQRRRAYTLWAWRNLLWDSRESAIPTCPPSYSRTRGVNPRLVVKPDAGLGSVD